MAVVQVEARVTPLTRTEMVNPSDPMGTIYLWRESVLGDRFEPEMDEPF